jgi:hemolysin activation/secretion protein
MIPTHNDVIGAWIPGHLQLLGLADTARVRTNEDEFEPGSNHRDLSSAGLGFSWLALYGLQLRLMASHKLGDERATSDTDRETRVWLQLLDRF